jgi:hypothetical protein
MTWKPCSKRPSSRAGLGERSLRASPLFLAAYDLVVDHELALRGVELGQRFLIVIESGIVLGFGHVTVTQADQGVHVVRVLGQYLLVLADSDFSRIAVIPALGFNALGDGLRDAIILQKKDYNV